MTLTPAQHRALEVLGEADVLYERERAAQAGYSSCPYPYDERVYLAIAKPGTLTPTEILERIGEVE